MQQIINNNEGGFDVRAALNQMLTELYGAISLPIKLPNLAANAQIPVPANSYVWNIFIQWAEGNPILSIGTSGGGGEIVQDLEVTFEAAAEPIPIAYGKLFMDPANLYFTLNGGKVNISVIMTKGIF